MARVAARLAHWCPTADLGLPTTARSAIGATSGSPRFAYRNPRSLRSLQTALQLCHERFGYLDRVLGAAPVPLRARTIEWHANRWPARDRPCRSHCLGESRHILAKRFSRPQQIRPHRHDEVSETREFRRDWRGALLLRFSFAGRPLLPMRPCLRSSLRTTLVERQPGSMKQWVTPILNETNVRAFSHGSPEPR